MKHRTWLRASLLIAMTIIAPLLQNEPANAEVNPTLTINKLGLAGGTVSAAGINCGGDCSESYPAGTIVTLTASTDAGRRFAYWTNGVACAGGNNTPTCQFTITQSTSLGLLWDYSSVDIIVSKKGTGSGTVTGSGINCGSDCGTSLSLPLYPGSGSTTTQALSALAASDSTFVGWETDGNICTSGGGKGGSAVRNPNAVCSATISSLEKTFTAVALFEKKPAATTNGPSGVGGTQPPTPAHKATEAAPPALSVEIKLDGAEIRAGENVVIKNGAPLLLGGKTVPKGIVAIYVFSEPKKYTTEANEDGTWNYKLTDLPPGEHHIEAEVTDPATGKTSPRTQVLAFSVNENTTPSANKAAPKEGSSAMSGWILTVSALLGAALCLICVAKFRPTVFEAIKRRLGIGRNKPGDNKSL